MKALFSLIALSLLTTLALDNGAEARGKKHEKAVKEAVSETQVRERDAHGRFKSRKQSAGEAAKSVLGVPESRTSAPISRSAHRAGSDLPKSGFHCLGIGKGHHTKGMTEADCSRMGGRVEH